MSPNFYVSECRCRGVDCCGGAYPMDRHFMYKLELLRDDYGKPIHVTSGFRCPRHNEGVGGVENSLHTLGRATDCTCEDIDELCRKAQKYFSEVILYRVENFVHIADE